MNLMPIWKEKVILYLTLGYVSNSYKQNSLMFNWKVVYGDIHLILHGKDFYNQKNDKNGLIRHFQNVKYHAWK